MVININVVKNGFIVTPSVPSHCDVSDEETVVFETHDKLFEYLSKRFPISTDATKEVD